MSGSAAKVEEVFAEDLRELAIDAVALAAEGLQDAIRQGDLSAIYRVGESGGDPLHVALLRQGLVDRAYEAKAIRDAERVARMTAGLAALAGKAVEVAVGALIASAVRR